VPLISLAGAELAFGLHPLLDGAGLSVDDGERIGLIGRNGTGKSSLLSVIAGSVPLDGGELQRRDGLVTIMVEQEPQLPPGASLRESLWARGGLETGADDPRRWQREARLAGYLDRGDGARGSLRRGTQARGPGPRLRAGARPAAPRRAHQPPRPRRHPAAGGTSATRADVHRHQP